MPSINEILAAHEAGHWTAAHATGTVNAGVHLSLAGDMPGHVPIARNRFVSTWARNLIAWGGWAGEAAMFGPDEADINRAKMDFHLLLGACGHIDGADQLARGLLERHRALFEAVFDLLLVTATAGQVTTIPDQQLRELADSVGVGFGADAVTPDFGEGCDWLALACRSFQEKQQGTRDVSIIDTDPGMLTVTVNASSNERPDMSTFATDWEYFAQAVAEAGFTVTSQTSNARDGSIDQDLELLFTAADAPAA
jgi:hypothetical protein